MTHQLNDGIWRARQLRLATGMVVMAALATSARAEDASGLSGFYANSGNECMQATGVLYMCTANHCVSQDYRYGATLYPNPANAKASVAPNSQVDGNGFQLQAGDVTLEYERDGGRSIRIVRPSGASLLTTYSARVDATGNATFSFIQNGIAMDPSVKAQNLVQCPAYAGSVQNWLTEGAAPRQIAPMAEPPQADPDIRIGPEDSLIKMVFEPTAKGAHIAEVVPFTLNDPEYPALLVLWVVDLGGTKVPLQVLTYDHETSAYVDGTEEVFEGRIPKADNPRAASIFGTDKGLGIVIANTGLDRAPFSRATNTLILPTGDGRLKDASRMLPQDLQFSHDVSTGVINERGDIGIYINSMYIPEYFILRGGRLMDVSADYLPDVIHRDDKKFAASALADVNGDGFADLVLGSGNEHLDASVIYLNNGKGRFDRKGPIELPRTPFPERKLEFVDRTVGAGIVDIQQFKLDESQPYDDLLVTSNDAYMGYATQILKNDGNGAFTDVTAQVVHGDATAYYNNTGKPYTWQLRALPFDAGRGPDILTKSEARFEVPSYVFGNSGDGTFSVAASVIGSAITNAGRFGGTNMLIRLVDTTEIVLTAYPAQN